MPVDDIKMVFAGACDNPHYIFPAQSFKYLSNTVNENLFLLEQRSIQCVAFVTKLLDVLWTNPFFCGQVPSPFSLYEQKLDIVLFG